MQPAKRPFRKSIAPALTGSVLLHACLAIALWQLPSSRSAVSVAENYVPIELRALREMPAPPPEPEPEPEPEAEVAPATAPEPPPGEPVSPDPELPESAIIAAEPLAAELPDEPPVAETDIEPAPDDAQEPPRQPLVPEEVEFEAVHRDAVARVVETLREEFNKPQFTVTESGETVPLAEDDPFGDGSALDLFDRAARLPSDGIGSPARARSRIGRRIADLCNDLTGGFSFFGLVNVCADPAARADLFGHLRPEYMESVPLCSAEEDLDIDVQQTNNGAVGSLKCVLIPREVRAEIYGRFDPDLAGWLPAENDSSATGSTEIAD